MSARLGSALAALALWLAAGAEARDLVQRGDTVLELTGSVRELATLGRGTDADRFAELVARNPIDCASAASFADCPAFDAVGERDVWTSLTRLRLRFDLRTGGPLSATVAYDNELRFGILRTLEQGLGEALASDDLFDLDRDIHVLGLRDDSDHARWRHALYRAFVRLEGRRAELVVGRQRIAWGVGRLWNPLDRLNPIPPLAIEADESPGIDALNVKWRFSGFTFLEGVWAPGGRTADAAWALRLHGVWRDVDYSLVAGVFDRAPTAGLDLAANLGAAAVRFEAVYADPERDVWPIGAARPRELDPFWQVLVSADHRFALGSGLYALVEHLYNGNALGFGSGRAGVLLPLFEATRRVPRPLADLPPEVLDGLAPFVRPADRARFGGSRVVTAARHQTGLQLAYDLTPALALQALAIVDWNGSSAAFFPMLRYTGLDWVEISLGGQVFAGPRRSQYGEAEPLLFLLADFFF